MKIFFWPFQTIFEQNGRRFYECDVEIWDAVNNVGLRNHYVCAVYATRLMIQCRMNAGKDDVCRGTALIVNVSSYGGLFYMFNVAYGAGKAAVIIPLIYCFAFNENELSKIKSEKNRREE